MDSAEGEIIFRICKLLGIMPSEVLKIKYTLDGRFLWRRFFLEIKAEKEHAEEMERANRQ